MAYRVVNETDNMREKYFPRKGLEGPFNFSGMVLYYDPSEGQYWNPKSDFYVSNDEMTSLHLRLIKSM